MPSDEITFIGFSYFRKKKKAFVGVLRACGRSGPGSVYRLTPKVKHYACMVELLGRAGRSEEAESLVRAMPVHPGEIMLGPLLFSGGFHGKLDLGRRLMEELVKMDPQHAAVKHVHILSRTFRGNEEERNPKGCRY